MLYSVRRARHKRKNSIWFHIYEEHTRWSNSQRQKEGWWSPEAEGVGNGELVFHGDRLSV